VKELHITQAFNDFIGKLLSNKMYFKPQTRLKKAFQTCGASRWKYSCCFYRINWPLKQRQI